MSADLLRQRRNLIILTCVMWFLQYAQIEIDKFAILGIEFSKFQNPVAVFTALWIIWLYFAWRYYQYFMQEGVSVIKENYLQFLQDYTGQKIQNYIKQLEPNAQLPHYNFSLLKTNKWKFTYKVREQNAGINAAGYIEKSCDVEIPKNIFIKDYLKTFSTLFFNRSVLTDYLLPIILFIGVFIYSFKGWIGSFLSVLYNLFC